MTKWYSKPALCPRWEGNVCFMSEPGSQGRGLWAEELGMSGLKVVPVTGEVLMRQLCLAVSPSSISPCWFTRNNAVPSAALWPALLFDHHRQTMGWDVLHPSLHLRDWIVSVMKTFALQIYFVFFRAAGQEIRFEYGLFIHIASSAPVSTWGTIHMTLERSISCLRFDLVTRNGFKLSFLFCCCTYSSYQSRKVSGECRRWSCLSSEIGC